MAEGYMRRGRSDHTLQPTALVHEAYLRLMEGGNQNWRDRSYFFAAAAEAMRRILIDNARRKQRLKHGGGQQRIDLDSIDVAITSNDAQLIALDEAVEKLAQHDKQGAELVKLRFFAGLPNIQAAEILGIPERSAKRVWAYARSWLLEELQRR